MLPLLLLLSLLHLFELYVFTLFVFNASLVLVDYGQPALMSKPAFLAARYCVARLFTMLFVTCLCYAHVTTKYDDDGDNLFTGCHYRWCLSLSTHGLAGSRQQRPTGCLSDGRRDTSAQCSSAPVQFLPLTLSTHCLLLQRNPPQPEHTRPHDLSENKTNKMLLNY